MAIKEKIEKIKIWIENIKKEKERSMAETAKQSAETTAQEKWVKGVAITTTCLAVLTAIAASRSSYCVAQAQLLTALEGSKWAYYQAKSIKLNLAETQYNAFQLDNLSASNTPEQKVFLTQNLADYKKNITRYNVEKEDIRKEAEKVAKDNAILNRRGGHFSMSVVFFQIGIMLSSVSALIKSKQMWYAGLVFGVIAIVLLANGALLFF